MQQQRYHGKKQSKHRVNLDEQVSPCACCLSYLFAALIAEPQASQLCFQVTLLQQLKAQLGGRL
jgi:hypothetical protein